MVPWRAGSCRTYLDWTALAVLLRVGEGGGRPDGDLIAQATFSAEARWEASARECRAAYDIGCAEAPP